MIARYGDLLIGVVPIVNLEWIQKIHRDTRAKGYSVEAGGIDRLVCPDRLAGRL